MTYERYILPLVATVAAGAFLGSRRRRRRIQDEPGTFVYGYPLEVEDEISNSPVSLVDLEAEVMDEEMFPGFHQDG